jgi:hypothetical protein
VPAANPSDQGRTRYRIREIEYRHRFHEYGDMGQRGFPAPYCKFGYVMGFHRSIRSRLSVDRGWQECTAS